jgi:hypothetical protein
MVVPVPAQAAKFSGLYLMQICASDKNGREMVANGHIACQSYISGIVDYHNLIRSLGGAPSVDFCIPDNVTPNRLQAVVLAYLYANKKNHESFVASPAVALALHRAYPCKVKK